MSPRPSFCCVQLLSEKRRNGSYAEAALAERRVALACDRVALSSDFSRLPSKKARAGCHVIRLLGWRQGLILIRLQGEAMPRRQQRPGTRNLRAALVAYWQAEGDFQTRPPTF